MLQNRRHGYKLKQSGGCGAFPLRIEICPGVQAGRGRPVSRPLLHWLEFIQNQFIARGVLTFTEHYRVWNVRNKKPNNTGLKKRQPKPKLLPNVESAAFI